MTNSELTTRVRKVKLLITDVDGVLTDGSFYIGDQGQELKRFHAFDGAAVALLKAVDFPVAIISGRHSEVTTHRMRELGLDQHLYQGNLAKIEPYRRIRDCFQLPDAAIAYIGDDLADIPLLRRVGAPFTVANALPEVKKHAIYVTEKSGGCGAFREVIELIFKIQGIFDKALAVVTKDHYKEGI